MNNDNYSQSPANLIDTDVKGTLDLGTIWIESFAVKAFEGIIYAESMDCSVYELLQDFLERHARGEYGDMDEKEAHEIEGKVRSAYGGVYGSEIEIETDLKEKVTRVIRG